MTSPYLLTWNQRIGKWRISSETSLVLGKQRQFLMTLSLNLPFIVGTVMAHVAAPSLANPSAPAPTALPVGAQISSGAAHFTQSATQQAATLTVNQSSERLVTHWQSFDIGTKATVEFKQPSSQSVALNRVVGSDVSRIFGQLSANGQVFLVNPAGIYFSPSARVDVGALVASSLKISDSSFLTGQYRFEGDDRSGAVRNEGVIRTRTGGMVAMLAPQGHHGVGRRSKH
jgi:filamentous hemagglutinin family protein